MVDKFWCIFYVSQCVSAEIHRCVANTFTCEVMLRAQTNAWKKNASYLGAMGVLGKHKTLHVNYMENENGLQLPHFSCYSFVPIHVLIMKC